MRKVLHCSALIALLLAVNVLIGPQFINTVSGAEVEPEIDDGVVEDLQVSSNCVFLLFSCSLGKKKKCQKECLSRVRVFPIKCSPKTRKNQSTVWLIISSEKINNFMMI